jgi:voltage-gated potassium channel
VTADPDPLVEPRTAPFMASPSAQKPAGRRRRRLHEIIFETDTPAGRVFDIVLIGVILASVLTVVLESVPAIRARYGPTLHALEWGFTALFTAEYVLRLLSVRKPLRYALSPFGLIDLMATAPTYAGLFLPGAQALLVVRFLRVLRIFRILKLTEHLNEARVLTNALWASRRKISVFFLSVLTLITIIGALMYLIEGEENGFTDIPTSIYWAVVTLTTVGYGDISPKTGLGRAASALVMIIGYSIIAVPTGIVTVELSRAGRAGSAPADCPKCRAAGHDGDARYCKYCGAALAAVPADGL